MAMIQCPCCGDYISDKAKKCVHCGCEVMPKGKWHCIECGSALEIGATMCTKCGCPVDNEMKPSIPVAPQQVEVTGIKVARKSKKKIVNIAVVLFLIFVALFSIQQVQKQNVAKEYVSNLELATTAMLSGAAKAETCGNLIGQVWQNAIYENQDSKTDKYTRPNGYWVSDFNDALNNLFSDRSFTSQLTDIQSNQSMVQSVMKNLKNPPEEYEDAYEAIVKLYDAYTKLTNLVVNPTGSLRTFSSNFDNADTEIINCYDAMKLYID